MTNDQLRATFEAHYKLPAGVSWDGDHYIGSVAMASHTNATIWNHMYRGFRAAAKEFGHAS